MGGRGQREIDGGTAMVGIHSSNLTSDHVRRSGIDEDGGGTSL